jgi:hypothetical protein
MKAKYTRLYTDDLGESHFEELETQLVPSDFAPPSPPLDLSSPIRSQQFAFLGAPAGWQSDWHASSSRNMFVVVSGEWEIQTSDGQVRRFGPNTVLLVEDTSGKGHRSRVVSDAESLAVAIQLQD